MNTKKAPSLNFAQVEAATLTLRAYRHRIRNGIVGQLLENGRMSCCQIASCMALDEPYIAEQLDILHSTGLVQSEDDGDGLSYFHANVQKLTHIKNVIMAFNRESLW